MCSVATISHRQHTTESLKHNPNTFTCIADRQTANKHGIKTSQINSNPSPD